MCEYLQVFRGARASYHRCFEIRVRVLMCLEVRVHVRQFFGVRAINRRCLEVHARVRQSFICRDCSQMLRGTRACSPVLWGTNACSPGFFWGGGGTRACSQVLRSTCARLFAGFMHLLYYARVFPGV